MSWRRRTLGLAALVTLLAGARTAPGQGRQAFIEAREQMVEKEIIGAGIKDQRVIRSMRDTPRHEFCPVGERKNAYLDMALPIGESQTISPPFVVAYMTQELDPQPEDRVLEIGTGSGYQAAVLSPLVREVYSIEIVESLGLKAAKVLKRLKYANVLTKVGDGYQGWSEHAPFDKIIVTCSPEDVPQPLVDQLKEGGRLVIPLGERYQQTLYLYRKQDGKLVEEALLPTMFVPMTGAAEDERQIKPDPLNPTLLNGSFEELSETGETGMPMGWHYLRQIAVVQGGAPRGKCFVTFSNQEPGRTSQALQAFAIDGREIPKLDIRFQVKAENVRPGRSKEQLPKLVVTFYDQRRAIVGTQSVGPWRGSLDWREEHEELKVPKAAREAIMHIGLLGSVGQISFDGLEMTVPKKDAQ